MRSIQHLMEIKMEMLVRVRDSAYECQESQEIECEGLKKLKLFRRVGKC
jgi:hypothetical protein